MIKFIQNIGEYFSSNYFDEDFTSKVLSKTGYAAEDIKDFNKRISPLKDKFFRFKQLLIEDKLRIKDKIYESHQFHTALLNALGYDGNHPQYSNLFHLSENEVIPLRHILNRGDKAHLMIMEMQALIKEDDTDPDGLFEQRYNVEDETQNNPPQKYHRTQWDRVFQVPANLKISPVVINKALSELFLFEPHLRPKFILLLAGNIIYLLEQEKWFRGSYLIFDLEELFTEATANRNANYYALLYFLLSKESLTPESNMVLLDQLDEDSHKSAYEVTKDLKEGIIHAVEALANEALYFQKNVLREIFDETDDTFEQEIKDDCLNIIYRLLFVFYAESREDLDILPSNDPIYNKGYSLEMLRDLEQVPLYSENSLNGYFFHESLSKLFEVLSSGYREKENGQNKSFKVRHIDSPLFNNAKLHHLHKVKFRNKVWQDIICRLSLSKQQRNRTRGRISYANLGINQLGSVYESLLAYRGFYAEQDYIEVHKADVPNEGTFLVPRMRRDDFQENEILKDAAEHDIITKKGTFVYRLSGRDRQKSASYYTPEVLTRCTVKYTLKPILEKLDKGEMKATELLELKLLEPAMGAAAFQNEMINQLAEAYLTYRQKELKKRVAPDLFKEELQKVKAYIATNNTYGVDLNPTAIELGKLSLWLNVIHKDMETPFFSNRLAVGNAVVGAWLKVFKEKDLIEEDEIIKDGKGKQKRVPMKKEWWETAPRKLEFAPNKDYSKIKHKRKQDEIYHFLLPDKSMVPSAGIKMLKTEYDNEIKAVTKWRKDFCEPLKKSEIEKLKKICDKIDELFSEFYFFQRTINIQTANKQEIFGVSGARILNLKTYDEKEALADQRKRHNAPYFKLKMVMDYWCSLWFWDVRDAKDLPNRQQYWQDIAAILELDFNLVEAFEAAKKKAPSITAGMQPKLFYVGGEQLALGEEIEHTSVFAEAVVEYTNRKDLFDNNQRLAIISQLDNKYFFFHPQLEFLDVFWERGGFDLIAGNPPWLKFTFEEKGIIAEKFPEVEIKSVTAPQVRLLQAEFFKDEKLKDLYYDEMVGTECIAVFMNAGQNYPLLKGQQTNLYKCVLENGFSLLSKNGFMGLLHPEGVYDDPNGQPLRKEIYPRLKYHFQYTNELSLFAEVHHNTVFGTQVYSGNKGSISFYSISNLFHPSTIDGSFIPNHSGVVSGIKIKEETSGKFIWNIKPHSDRVVHFTDSELKVMVKTFENSDNWESAKLVTVHSSSVISVLEKLSKFKNSINNYKSKITEGWHETNDVDAGIIKRATQFPDITKHQLVYSGPHFYVANPIYKTPTEQCLLNSDYDIVSHTLISEDFVARTNYIPKNNPEKFAGLINGFKTGEKDIDGNEVHDNWIDYYKVAFRKMLSQAGERTLNPSILPPNTTHTNGVVSIIFSENNNLIELSAVASSIVLDFFIKTVGASNLTDSRLSAFPLGVEEKFKLQLFNRTLQLNCLNKYYAPLWEESWKEDFKADNWSKQDARLKSFSVLTPNWQLNTPLRNWFERRQALVEIDVITAMALGLTLQELILIYNVQFPVLQQNEDDTWYDTKGNIVFTCSKGLVGVGVDRQVWENIRNLKAGETYEHTITKSELYKGKKITYHAPFDKCDRVEDYKVAWGHFEKIFNSK
ncbi:MAG: hypothetical protein IM591_12955 [Chitinophagaceae bacterium]|nr:hypothetical protein [Chitinophagaceae bacterium]